MPSDWKYPPAVERDFAQLEGLTLGDFEAQRLSPKQARAWGRISEWMRKNLVLRGSKLPGFDNLTTIDDFVRRWIGTAIAVWHVSPDEAWKMSLDEMEAAHAAHQRERQELASSIASELRKDRPNHQRRDRQRIEQDRVKRWLAKTHPDGVPDQVSKPDAVLQNELFRAGITAQNGKDPPSISTIRRATGRRVDK
jgi:hypothetical protein